MSECHGPIRVEILADYPMRSRSAKEEFFTTRFVMEHYLFYISKLKIVLRKYYIVIKPGRTFFGKCINMVLMKLMQHIFYRIFRIQISLGR